VKKKDKRTTAKFPLIKVALTLAFSLIITFTLVAASCGKGKDAESEGTETSKSIEKEKDSKESNSKSSGKSGTLTVTGIPKEYNGKYARLGSMFPILFGFKSLDKNSPDYMKLPQISKGSVSIPLWGGKNFTGNEDVMGVAVSIFDTDTADGVLVSIMFMSVPLKNGKAKVAWKDGQIVKD
jgi:hypothetical protein